MANWTAYRALKAESETQGLPIHYRTDLTKHDRRRLSRKDAPAAFIWVLRQSGTYLLQLGNPDELSWLLAIYNTHGPRPTSGRQARWYICRDGQLTHVAPQVARDVFIDSVIGLPVRSARSDIYLGELVTVDPRPRSPIVRARKIGESARSFALNNVIITMPEDPREYA